MRKIFALLNKLIRLFGFYLIKKSTLKDLLQYKLNHKEQLRILHLIKKVRKLNLSADLRSKCEDLILTGSVKSQDLQDIKAYILCNEKQNGFYVEFGADDGIKNSNTFLLNQNFAWKGILAEPNPDVFEQCKTNRKSDLCLNDLIYNKTGMDVDFCISGQLSTINGYVENDNMETVRKNNSTKTIKLKTKTLLDVLTENNAPSIIDFLSIDTEGSEFEILSAFDFKKYNINVICFEHNNNIIQKEKIQMLLMNNGYSEVVFEDNSIDCFFKLNI
jgi:FkbM family methyltransferase